MANVLKMLLCSTIVLNARNASAVGSWLCVRCVAVVFRGNSFRSGKRGDYNNSRGVETNVAEQLNTSATHNTYLLDPLKDAGYHVIIHLVTYKSPVDSILEKTYSKWGPVFSLFEEMSENQGTGMQKVVSTYKKKADSLHVRYAYTIFIRIDLVLINPVFTSLVSLRDNPNALLTSEILYAMRCEIEIEKKLPHCVHDVMQVIPEALLEFFLQGLGQIGCYHTSGSTFYLPKVAQSGHSCYAVLERIKRTIPQGLLYAGCWDVRECHPLYRIQGRLDLNGNQCKMIDYSTTAHNNCARRL